MKGRKRSYTKMMTNLSKRIPLQQFQKEASAYFVNFKYKIKPVRMLNI
jgi:hypothetical protein